ncbi:hypothetical protein MYSTI_00828 [Myxococcus stipitatus DSM 14675]|uniref:Uncharacterized protein n=1 Tax=Myxococcus stipitatus (strain DSM 14675 / JCM 12634 / Mx s8) TaxID=1278073 RepID=L7U3L7_MYXSD|nr:hypothetical protein [Myxococcus stipitatus]AGC42177.1 hypothetical protein MYSTI_00828 [Myxococcus stipitatus DSM 14675]
MPRFLRGQGFWCLVVLVLVVAPWSPARAQARLRVAGATANNEVKLRTTSEDFRTVLRVDLLAPPSGAEAALEGGVTVLVDPLQASDGTQVTLSAVVREKAPSETSLGAPISSRSPLYIELSGALPQAGVYTGQVVLVHGGGREVATLIVTRVQAVPAVQFIATSPAVAESGWGLGPVDAVVRLPFKETAGVTGEVAVPQLIQLQHKKPDLGATVVQPRFAGASFSLEGGGKEGKDQVLAAAEGAVRVAANGSGTLLLHLRGLEGPGEYTGTVRLAVPQGVAVEQPFTVWVRTPWLWGALLIAAGAVSSYGVRLYTQSIRPRAQQLQRARVLWQRASVLLEGQGDAARKVGLEVRGRIDAVIPRIRGSVRGSRAADGELMRGESELRLFEAWCVCAKDLHALPSEMRPTQASQALADAEASLRVGNVPLERLEEQLKDLRGQNVQELARAGLKAKLKELETQARALTQKLGDDSLGFRITYELLPLLQEMSSRLGQGDLGAARQQFEMARRSYFDVLCAELSSAVASPRNPKGFSPEEWRELTTDVKERLRQARARADANVDEGFRLYQGAYAHYVRRLLMELRGVVVEARSGATEAQKPELDIAEARLKEAMLALAAESPHEAAAKYREVGDALQRAQTGELRRRIVTLREEVARKRSETGEPHGLAELGHVNGLLNHAEQVLTPETLLEAESQVDKAEIALASYPSVSRVSMSTRMPPFSTPALETTEEAASEASSHDDDEPGAAPRAPAPPRATAPGGSLPSAPTGGIWTSLPEASAEVSMGGLVALEALPLPSARHLWMVELVMLVLLTSVAVVLGLQLLNVFSPTWGGFGAGMTAFLWGFGLHQVGNASFEGLTGLLTRVERRGGTGDGA